jgi:hypothetical protein
MRQSGVESHLWGDPKISAFDMLDRAKPDVLISSHLLVTKDIMTYLSGSNIELVLNVTGISENQLAAMEDAFKQNGIRCPFVFSNNFGYKKLSSKNIKCHRIWPAADIFNVHQKRPGVIDECVVSQKFDESVENYLAKLGSYHLLYLGDNDLIPPFDFRSNVATVAQLYQFYKKVSFFGDADFCSSQVFFDANLQSHGASFYTPESERANWGSVLKDCFVEVPINSQEEVQAAVKQQIKTRHTPFHRAWTLMKHLKNQEAMKSIENIKNQIGPALKDI